MVGTVSPGQFTFAGGEVSRELGGRTDLALWSNSVLKSENFEVDAQGQLRFRTGALFISVTKDNQPAVLIPFVFSVLQSYCLELSNLALRILTNSGVVLDGSSNPIVVATPWATADLYSIRYDQDVDVMYACHNKYSPQKITRTSNVTWACNPVNFVDGPFLPIANGNTTMQLSGTGTTATLTASAATAINNGQGFLQTDVGRQVRLSDGSTSVVNSATVLNWWWYTITAVADGTHCTVSRGSATAPGNTNVTLNWRLGVFSDTTGWPSACQFYENRMYYLKDQVLYGSKAATLAADYDTFTEGVLATDPVTYVLPGGNSGVWLQEAQTFLGVGTFGSVRRANGGNDDAAITPSSISIKSISSIGVAPVQPILSDRDLIYVGRDATTVYTLEYDALSSAYVSRNRNITAQHLTRAGILQSAFQLSGNPKIWFAVRSGRTAGITYLPEQQVYGWHSQRTLGNYLSVCAIPQVNGGSDKYWQVVQRVLNGVTTYCVEQRPDEVVYPNLEDFYNSDGADDKATDTEAYLEALYEAQKQACHLDCALVYDGRLTGTLTLSATGTVEGDVVACNCTLPVFTVDDVGKQITGAPWGRAEVTAFTDAQNVTLRILTPFRTTTLVTQQWYKTAQIFSAPHLANMPVTALADGQVVEGLMTDNAGTVDLRAPYGYVTLGLGYQGLIIGNVVEGGSQIGTSQTKPKHIERLSMRFLHTNGARVGSDVYNLTRVDFPKTNLKAGWATPLFTGDQSVPVPDGWDPTKRWVVNQRAPLPCKLQMIVPQFETTDM